MNQSKDADSRWRAEAKKRVGQPLNNLQLICLFLHQRSLRGHTQTRSHLIRKFVYLQRFGSMRGWTSGFYGNYFKDCAYGASQYVNKLWERADVGGDESVWKLTHEGRLVAWDAKYTLGERTNAWVK